VRNLIAERDRSIQLQIAKNTARDQAIQLAIAKNTAKDQLIQLEIAKNTGKDGFNMKVIAVLTSMFLPGTFMGVRPITDYS
jgi:hypothetical protein